MVLRLRWESALIWTASRSKENSLTYCLNFFSEIRERLTYLFLIVIVELTAFHVKSTRLDPCEIVVFIINPHHQRTVSEIQVAVLALINYQPPGPVQISLQRGRSTPVGKDSNW